MERLYRERYQGFTVKHFHEHLVKDHGFGWGYTWTKLHLQWMGVVGKAPRKGAHRRKRERRPLPGMMLHQDGSRHAWLEGQGALDLIRDHGRRDGAIYSAFLVAEEGTASTFLQDRLVNALALAGITDIEAANAFLREVYLPAHNARFAVPPAGEGSAFTPIPGVDLDDILCVEEERQVGHDNCVSDRTLKAPDPAKPDAAPFRQGAGQGPRLRRRLPRRLPRAALHRPLRRERNDHRCQNAA